MNNQNLIRGVFLMVIALVFGSVSITYKVGLFVRPGPGMFPLIVSSLLFMIGLFMVVRARFVAAVAMDYNVKNITLVLTSLCGFVVLSQYISMILGIAFLVFCSSFAATSYSNVRNVKVTFVLVLIAFGFQKLLGLNLPLL